MSARSLEQQKGEPGASGSVTVTTVVEVAPETAFTVFTEEVDAWWKHGPRFRPGGDRPSSMRFESGVGGRLLEVYEDPRVGAAYCKQLPRPDCNPFIAHRLREWTAGTMLRSSAYTSRWSVGWSAS